MHLLHLGYFSILYSLCNLSRLLLNILFPFATSSRLYFSILYFTLQLISTVWIKFAKIASSCYAIQHQYYMFIGYWVTTSIVYLYCYITHSIKVICIKLIWHILYLMFIFYWSSIYAKGGRLQCHYYDSLIVKSKLLGGLKALPKLLRRNQETMAWNFFDYTLIYYLMSQCYF